MLKTTRVRRSLFIFLLCFLVTAGFSADWIFHARSGKLPADLADQVAARGGRILKSWPGAGICVAAFLEPDNPRDMETASLAVMPDLHLNFIPAVPLAQADHIGENESYYPYQWHLPVIHAPMAWDAGCTGMGVRVAIVDTGICYPHPDLYGNIDFAASASFVPGVTDFMDDHGHGTHVAGIVAAIDNDWGSIGIAPDATLIGVKVLDENGSGNISWIVAGIIHACMQEADVVNLSLGSYMKKNGNPPYYTARDAAAIVNMYRHVINWAMNRCNCLVVCSAGNDALNLNKIANWIKIPAQAGSGIVVSATGPVGLQNFDNLAAYSNFGQSAIWLAAPGGDFQLIPGPGWYLDMVFSTYVGGWAWMAGTSQAAPMVSGVAALVIGKYGHVKVSWLKNFLARKALDLGKPGHDACYGHGRVDAGKAVED